MTQMVSSNLRGTVHTSFKIHNSGPIIYQGNNVPTAGPSYQEGDLYIQHSNQGKLYQYKGGAWVETGQTAQQNFNIVGGGNAFTSMNILYGETTSANAGELFFDGPGGSSVLSLPADSVTLIEADFENAYPASGFLNITNGSAQFSLYPKSDRSTEGPEKFSVEIRAGGSNGAILATSPEVTINDTSLSVGANANNLTFGPVRVNRDGGNISDVSDWYDICSLDQLPEGGKVAIFIDTSGSMTMSTVSQSYNKLVEKLNERNITIITVTNSNEDWITPFLTDLS